MKTNVQHSQPKMIIRMFVVMGVVNFSSVCYANSSIDCGKAKGAIEKLVCTDNELSQLDVKLAELYSKASKTKEKNKIETQPSTQQLWSKSLNTCTKSKEKQVCIKNKYKQQITQLQVNSGVFAEPTPVTYNCGEASISAAFYKETELPSVVLTASGRHPGGDYSLAFMAPSGSGAKYESKEATFWEHQGEAKVIWFGHELICKVG